MPDAVVFDVQLRTALGPLRCRVAIDRRFRAAAASLDRLGLLPVWLGDDYDDERAYESALTALQSGIDCPLLEDDLCSIHALRPLRCREHNVTSPAAWCAEPESHPVQTLPMPTPLSAPLARLAAELTGTPVRLVPLTLALLWADQHPELGARTWPGPELFEGFLRHFGSQRDSEAGEGNPPAG